MRLPEEIERDYMRLRMSIVRQVGSVVEKALSLRTDAEDDEPQELLALLALLGLTSKSIINERKLRQKLYRIAHRLTDFELAQLSAHLGRKVFKPNPLIIEDWVDEQTESIVKHSQSVIERAAQVVGGLAVGGLASVIAANQVFTPEEHRGAVAASSATLALNVRLQQSSAFLSGSRNYIWSATIDDVTRDSHAALDGTVQSWDIAPAGGGTNEGEAGHPGSGINCRCIAIPVTSAG